MYFYSCDFLKIFRQCTQFDTNEIIDIEMDNGKM